MALTLAGCPQENGINCDSESVFCSARCVTVDRDPLNCGSCGIRCDAGELCVDGECTITCPSGQSVCNERCVDLQTDALNCGTCGSSCAAGSLCNQGACVAQCPAGLTACDGRCVDLQIDESNCGFCGETCDRNETCVASECSCGAPLTACTNRCVDTSTAVSDCGQCGDACLVPGEICNDGRCECGPGESICPDVGCVDLQRDLLNCGRCGRVCGSAQACRQGTCGPIVTCEANAVPPATCDAFPLDFAICGEPAVTTTLVTTSTTLVARELRFDIPRLQADQQAVARFDYSARSTGVTTSYRNSQDVVLPLGGGSFIPPTTSNLQRQDVGRGQRLMSANPTEFVIEQSGLLNVDGRIDIETLNGRYNSGGVDPLNATPIDDEAPLCSQLCGASVGVPGDDRHYYAITIPPRGRLDFEYAARAFVRTNMASGVAILDPRNGTRLCESIRTTVYGLDWRTSRGRALNNLDRPLTVVVAVLAPIGEFKMSVATSTSAASR